METMFQKNIKYLLNSKRITANKILQITGGRSSSLVYMWKSGERFITTEDAVKLANYLGCTIDDLVNHDLREMHNQYDDLTELFIQNKNLLTEDDKDTIRFIIEKRVKENERQ